MPKQSNPKVKVNKSYSNTRTKNLKGSQTQTTSKFKNRKKRTNLIIKFLTLVGIIVGSFVVIISVIVFGFLGSKLIPVNINGKQAINSTDKNNTNINSGLSPTSVKSTFFVMGVDKSDNLSDFNMLVHFNSDRKRIDLLSIPRDTKIVLDNEAIAEFKRHGRNPPVNGMKLTELNSYAGPNLATKYMTQEVEKLLGIKVDHYAQVDLDTFVKLVDLIGGVEMEIRPQGLYYNDPTQNLVINIPGGLQVLDGKMAEGLVRFRSYPDADLERIRIQQKFLTALFKQTLSKENIIRNIPGLVNIFLQYINTDFTFLNALKYISFLTELDTYQIHTHTMPIIRSGIYVIKDLIPTNELVNEIFYSNSISTVDNTSKNLNIRVLNGGNIDGYASQVSSFLTSQGYTVTNIGNYTGVPTNETRIITRDNAFGKDLISYFKNAVIEVDESLNNAYDIMIIIGMDEDETFK